MINTPKNECYDTIKYGVTEYGILFPFQYNHDKSPQLSITIGGVVLRQNVDYKISEDQGTLILIPLEDEKPEDPNDFSWMNKWVGKELVIERDVPFVQESDYQLGRISSEQIEKDFDLSVMRDQMLQQQITDNDADLESLFDTVAEHREDIDRAQKSADDAMAHSVAVEKRVTVNEKGIAANKEAAARAQKTADDAMAHTVAVEKRVTQAEKNIASNDVDIANIFDHQEEQDGRLTNLENSKIDKDQGKINIGKVLTVGGDGMVVPKVPQGGGSGIGVVAHDSTLIGAGTDEYPLGVKDKVTITIEDWE